VNPKKINKMNYRFVLLLCFAITLVIFGSNAAPRRRSKGGSSSMRRVIRTLICAIKKSAAQKNMTTPEVQETSEKSQMEWNTNIYVIGPNAALTNESKSIAINDVPAVSTLYST
jgi:hypothetical protein